ncbi:hypothetical protein [Streptomyces sp. LaBMicrA B280]|uniref:hypothetical protein n=1 Tax=Streptomyces sp. LaBMicrA B280 TaxID=3391001 RepID=UPI003BA7E42A
MRGAARQAEQDEGGVRGRRHRGRLHRLQRIRPDGKWIDGEVSIYKDVDENTKLPTATDQHPVNEIKITGAGSTWQYAKGMATGKYGGNKWADDLVVRWVDGEVTKYTNVDAGGFHAEQKLLAPNGLWKDYADIIAAGDFDGSVNSDFDLFVKWADGEVSVYGDTQADTLGREYMLVPPPARTAPLPLAPSGARRGEDRPVEEICEQACGPGLLRRSATGSSLIP